jgi:hypothetical protein
MKKSAISFATLRRLLNGLGLVETKVPRSHLVFEHPPSGTILLFRLFRPQEKVPPIILLAVRKQLIERGVVAEDTLDELLHQPSP